MLGQAGPNRRSNKGLGQLDDSGDFMELPSYLTSGSSNIFGITLDPSTVSAGSSLPAPATPNLLTTNAAGYFNTSIYAPTTGPTLTGQANPATNANWWENIITQTATTGLKTLQSVFSVPNLPTGSTMSVNPQTGQVTMTNVGAGSNVSPLAMSAGSYMPIILLGGLAVVALLAMHRS